jgi:hypothetical protein
MRRIRSLLPLSVGVLLLAIAGTSSAVAASSTHFVAERCPFSHEGLDHLWRGFSVSHFSAHNIHSVTLGYGGSGPHTVTLIARSKRYKGPLIGKSTETFNLGADGYKKVTFSFADVPVARGSRVTFVQHDARHGPIFYDVGKGGIGDETYDRCPGVTETNGGAPPLSHFRRASVGVVIRAVRR